MPIVPFIPAAVASVLFTLWSLVGGVPGQSNTPGGYHGTYAPEKPGGDQGVSTPGGHEGT
ncbi:MAG: hypothetical protein U0575_07445 [Phycisphaerales bacterium]